MHIDAATIIADSIVLITAMIGLAAQIVEVRHNRKL